MVFVCLPLNMSCAWADWNRRICQFVGWMNIVMLNSFVSISSAGLIYLLILLNAPQRVLAILRTWKSLSSIEAKFRINTTQYSPYAKFTHAFIEFILRGDLYDFLCVKENVIDGQNTHFELHEILNSNDSK